MDKPASDPATAQAFLDKLCLLCAGETVHDALSGLTNQLANTIIYASNDKEQAADLCGNLFVDLVELIGKNWDGVRPYRESADTAMGNS